MLLEEDIYDFVFYQNKNKYIKLMENFLNRIIIPEEFLNSFSKLFYKDIDQAIFLETCPDERKNLIWY